MRRYRLISVRAIRWAQVFCIRCWRNLKKRSPDIHISAEISNTQTLTEKILNSSLDLAIVPETVQQDSFEYLPFFDDDIVVICWPGHPLEGRTAALEEIAGEVFVGRESGSATDLL